MSDHQLDALSELLDRQIVDRDGRMVGKVDDLELEERDDGTLVVTALLVGAGALGPRLGGASGTLVTRTWAWLTGRGTDDVTRIDFATVSSLGSAIHLGVSRRSVDRSDAEDWVRTRIIDALPGAGTEPS